MVESYVGEEVLDTHDLFFVYYSHPSIISILQSIVPRKACVYRNRQINSK